MHEWVLWVAVTASALHVIEEHAFGWQRWAEATLGQRFGAHPTWTDFWATNAALIVFGFSCAFVGWQAAWFALGLPAYFLINAFVFHLGPSIAARRPNPGVFTATLLYVPIGVWVYVAASDDGVLTAGAVFGSILIGAGVLAAAIGVLALKPRFAYPDSV
jgi:hypothetical protein